MKEKELKKDRLPSDRLSSLVQVAIADAKRLYAERPLDYVPASERYHAPHLIYAIDSFIFSEGAPDRQCQICLAGAVIAGTLLGGNRKRGSRAKQLSCVSPCGNQIPSIR